MKKVSAKPKIFKNIPFFHKLTVSAIFFVITLFIVTPVFAHPGNTAADGCHYCRTNCDKWGVPWNARHCHGGSNTNTTGNPSGLSDQEEKELLDYLNSPEGKAEGDRLMKEFFDSRSTPTPLPKNNINSTQKSNDSESSMDKVFGLGVAGGLGYVVYKWVKK